MITLRPLRWRDALFCWRLASDPNVRRMSIDTRPPTVIGHWRWMVRHMGWFSRKAEASAVIIMLQGTPIGIETLKHYKSGFSVGISILPRYRSKGHGRTVLR